MKLWKIVYVSNGNKFVKTVKAKSARLAKIAFYMENICDDIIRIEEVR